MACLTYYVYSSVDRVCSPCEQATTRTLGMIGGLLLGVLLVLALHQGWVPLPLAVQTSWFVETLLALDSGTLRIIWSTYQVWLWANLATCLDF